MKKKEKSKRFLMSINVMGSAGAIRFVVDGDAEAAAVVDTALKMGGDAHTFFLYPAHAEFQPLNPRKKIGCGGARNFVLSKREKTDSEAAINRNKGSWWRAWLHKSLSLKISSH